MSAVEGRGEERGIPPPITDFVRTKVMETDPSSVMGLSVWATSALDLNSPLPRISTSIVENQAEVASNVGKDISSALNPSPTFQVLFWASTPIPAVTTMVLTPVATLVVVEASGGPTRSEISEPPLLTSSVVTKEELEAKKRVKKRLKKQEARLRKQQASTQ